MATLFLWLPRLMRMTRPVVRSATRASPPGAGAGPPAGTRQAPAFLGAAALDANAAPGGPLAHEGAAAGQKRDPPRHVKARGDRGAGAGRHDVAGAAGARAAGGQGRRRG